MEKKKRVYKTGKQIKRVRFPILYVNKIDAFKEVVRLRDVIESGMPAGDY